MRFSNGFSALRALLLAGAFVSCSVGQGQAGPGSTIIKGAVKSADDLIEGGVDAAKGLSKGARAVDDAAQSTGDAAAAAARRPLPEPPRYDPGYNPPEGAVESPKSPYVKALSDDNYDPADDVIDSAKSRYGTLLSDEALEQAAGGAKSRYGTLLSDEALEQAAGGAKSRYGTLLSDEALEQGADGARQAQRGYGPGPKELEGNYGPPPVLGSHENGPVPNINQVPVVGNVNRVDLPPNVANIQGLGNAAQAGRNANAAAGAQDIRLVANGYDKVPADLARSIRKQAKLESKILAIKGTGVIAGTVITLAAVGTILGLVYYPPESMKPVDEDDDASADGDMSPGETQGTTPSGLPEGMQLGQKETYGPDGIVEKEGKKLPN
jgi:hypothetical protein